MGIMSFSKGFCRCVKYPIFTVVARGEDLVIMMMVVVVEIITTTKWKIYRHSIVQNGKGGNVDWTVAGMSSLLLFASQIKLVGTKFSLV